MPLKRSDIGRKSRNTTNSAKSRKKRSGDKRASQNELIRKLMSQARKMQAQEERAARNTYDSFRMRHNRERKAADGAKQSLNNLLRYDPSIDCNPNRSDGSMMVVCPYCKAFKFKNGTPGLYCLKIIKKAKLLASETPEETKARLLRQSEKSARLRKERHANETPEQRNARLLREQEYNRNYRLKRKQMLQAMKNDLELKSASQTSTNATLTKFPKNENTDDDLIGSCTCSSFDTSEGSYSFTTMDGCSSTTDEIRTDKFAIVKNEPWSWYESETSHSNLFTCVKSDNMAPDTETRRDEHLEYGEYVADRFRKSNRNRFEINVAMKLIDDVILNLSLGRYKLKCSTETNVPAEKVKAPSLAMPNTVVQDIIVKEEVDL